LTGIQGSAGVSSAASFNSTDTDTNGVSGYACVPQTQEQFRYELDGQTGFGRNQSPNVGRNADESLRKREANASFMAHPAEACWPNGNKAPRLPSPVKKWSQGRCRVARQGRRKR
jgi:hypothetical protein